MDIKDILKSLGLNEKEVKTYLILLKNGRTKPADLAKMAKLNRATLYNVAKSLVAKGLAADDLSGKTLYFSPLPASALEGMLEQAKREVEVKEELVKKAVSELSLISADKNYPVPKIRFVEEDNLEKFLFDNITKWQREVIMADGVWRGFQDHSFVENKQEWIKATWKTKQCRVDKYKSQIISNISEVEKKLKGKYSKIKRDVRFLGGLDFTATVWVCGDYLVMIHTRRHPFYLFEIHDKALAHNMREVFKKLWELASESEKWVG